LRGIENISDFVVLDIGCGTGFLTEILSYHVKKIIGVDPSKVSISIAKNYAGKIQNLVIVHSPASSSDRW
jgi:2-polyprenyl-3-methyl-5-hydroxy-6-metoxy-1,4-benzoquinol methylase